MQQPGREEGHMLQQKGVCKRKSWEYGARMYWSSGYEGLLPRQISLGNEGCRSLMFLHWSVAKGIADLQNIYNPALELCTLLLGTVEKCEIYFIWPYDGKQFFINQFYSVHNF